MSENPYTSPSSSSPADAKTSLAPPPKSIKVFGILNIVFGLWGACGIGFSSLIFVMPQDPNMPNPALDLMRDNATYRMFVTGSLFLGGIATLVLIAAGIGLLKKRAWGRTLSIGYAVYGILAAVVGTVVNFFMFVSPMLEKAGDLAAGPEQGAAVGAAIGGVVGGCLGVIFPAILLYFMLRPQVAAALK